jgi:sterol desaturase/sphingolipid hydroxylase (fatty acid hydroxylase superfamily)
MHASDLMAALSDRASAFYLAQRSVQGYITLSVVFTIAFLLEVVARKQWRPRYLSRSFRLDVFYYFFYYGGLYHLLVFIPLYAVMIRVTHTYAPFLQMNLMGSVSPIWQMVIVILVADFFGYWIHRIKHTSHFLWPFHAIHHSQERLTVMTNYRFHVIDETLLRIGLFIPFQIVGTHLTMWITVDFVGAWILLLQHSEWNWTYGPFGRLVVSPRFHQIHHSTAPEHQNRNYAMLFSVWDDLFGTAERRAPAPARFGLGADQMPETFLGQLAWPFVRLLREWRSSPPTLPAPEPTPIPDR